MPSPCLGISKSIIQAAGKLLDAVFQLRQNDIRLIGVFLMKEVEKVLVSRKMIRMLVPVHGQHVLNVLSALLLCK